MSSAVVSTSAALHRHFIFDEESGPEVSLPADPESSRTPLDQTAEDGCRHISFPSTINHQPSTIYTIGNRKSAIENPIVPASRLEIRPAPEMVSTGIAELDSLTGGLPRGCLTEICGSASSGRTSLLLAALAAATRRGEFCALVDASDSLDPHSAAAVGIDMDRMLWVRCSENSPQRRRGSKEKFTGEPRINPPLSRSVVLSAAKNPLQNGGGKLNRRIQSDPRQSDPRQSEHRLEQVLRVTDLLLESGGFGLIALDLADLLPQTARRIPLTTWFRFRRAIEHTPTIMLAIEQQPIAGSCSSLLLQFGSQFSVLSSANTAAQQVSDQERKPSHAQLLTGLEISAELLRSRLSDRQFNSSLKTCPNRKPAGSVSIAFHSKVSWG